MLEMKKSLALLTKFCKFNHLYASTVQCKTIIRQSSVKRTLGLAEFYQHFHSSQICFKSVPITFIDRNGIKLTVDAELGDTLLDVAKDHDIDGVEGACGGTLACSTCHCIFKNEDFDRLNFEDDLTEEELDMLDLAYGLTDTSRLACQIDVTKELEDIEITVPTATSDARNS